MTVYAQFDNRSAYLSTDFGEELARKWFGDESVDALPRYVKGPRKGKIKGAITWTKVVRGGWVRTGRETTSGGPSGYVENRVGRIFDRKLHGIVSDRFGSSIGPVIRDLDAEESRAQSKKDLLARVDEEIRKYEMYRCCIEQIIISGEFAEQNKEFQKMISDFNKDIAILVDDYMN